MYWQYPNSASGRPPRWFQTDETIKHWLNERQALFILYFQLAQLLDSNHTFAIKVALPKFCQILMDYIAAGSFKIFEKLENAEAQCIPNASLDRDLLIKISGTTDIALAFNDIYVSLKIRQAFSEKDLHQLRQAFSDLGKQLAYRQDWENALIRDYLKITRGPPTQEPPTVSSRPSI